MKDYDNWLQAPYQEKVYAESEMESLGLCEIVEAIGEKQVMEFLDKEEIELSDRQIIVQEFRDVLEDFITMHY